MIRLLLRWTLVALLLQPVAAHSQSRPLLPGVFAAEGICSEDGWCWENPWPQGNDLAGVFLGKDEVWAVGGAGTILRSTSSGWRRSSSRTTEGLRAVWG